MGSSVCPRITLQCHHDGDGGKYGIYILLQNL